MSMDVLDVILAFAGLDGLSLPKLVHVSLHGEGLVDFGGGGGAFNFSLRPGKDGFKFKNGRALLSRSDYATSPFRCNA